MKKRFCLDANILINSWYGHYSIEVSYFHHLWVGLIALKNEGRIIIIDPILSEIEPISSGDKNMTDEQLREKYPLRKWMEDNHFNGTAFDTDDEDAAWILMDKYQTEESIKGINDNDARLVAYAGRKKHVVVTYEAKQGDNVSQHNKKIPRVCEEQKIECMTFVDMLKEIEK